MFDEYAFLQSRAAEINEEFRANRIRRERRRRRAQHHDAVMATRGRAVGR